MILSVVTGTYNRLSFLQNMIKSVKYSIPTGLKIEFCVCDGGSTDGTIEWLESQKNVKLVKHDGLHGAIKAFNDAAKLATGDYLLIANDDIEFIGDAVSTGLVYMMDNPEAGAACFYQDRGGKSMHVEHFLCSNGTALPYLQVGIVPRWLWEKCGGWGDWYPGGTYGGDNYISGRIYESGYKVVPLERCCISDKKASDNLRDKNEASNKPGLVWSQFPQGIIIPEGPIYKNPLPERKRVVYAPIIEAGHTVQKEQKYGLREALDRLGEVVEVDYVYSGESVVAAVEKWKPHYVITQFHTAASTSIEDIKKIRASCIGHMINWSGDVWNDQSTPEMMEILRYYDYHLTVNESLLQEYRSLGIRAAYWQNSFEPNILVNPGYSNKTDVIFIGNGYTEYRLNLVKSLKELPCKVSIYGRGYPESDGESLYDFKKTGALYRGAKIAIADNQYLSATGFASDRLFNSLASGGCMLMHQKVEGMERLLGLVDGVHYVSWDTIEDLKVKVDYFLNNEAHRTKIASAGHLECLTQHSFGNRVQELKSLLKKIPTTGRTLSTCMIVKNAEASIDSILRQTLEFSTEVVIVDTGSTDSTRDRIRSHPEYGESIKLFEFKWVNDFSAARNFGKTKCTGDYIFWIDSDEFLDTDSLEMLKSFGTWSFRSQGIRMPEVFKFPIVNYRGQAREMQSCYQIRIFRNIEKMVWGGAVHEHDYLEYTAKELGLSFLCLNGVKISHRVPLSRVEKEARNISLLMTMPESSWRSAYIAVSKAALEVWGEAAIWFHKAITQTDDHDTLDYLWCNAGLCFYRMDMEDEAIVRLRKSKFPDALFILAKITMSDKNFPVELLREFLATPTPTNFPSFADSWRDAAMAILRDFYWNELQKMNEALGENDL